MYHHRCTIIVYHYVRPTSHPSGLEGVEAIPQYSVEFLIPDFFLCTTNCSHVYHLLNSSLWQLIKTLCAMHMTPLSTIATRLSNPTNKPVNTPLVLLRYISPSLPRHIGLSRSHHHIKSVLVPKQPISQVVESMIQICSLQLKIGNWY